MNTDCKELILQVVDRIRKVVSTIPTGLHEPFLGGREWDYLRECLDSNYVSSVGTFVTRFESELAEYTGAKFAIAVVNGTSALHISLLLAGVHAGEEVLLPTLTFAATAAATTYLGAIPHFIDSSEKTLGIDPYKLRDYLKNNTVIRSGVCIHKMTDRVIRAVVPMHTFGHPVAMEELLEVAREYRLVVVEDAAESLGSTLYGRHTGTFGLLGVLSFNGNKIVTTGGGGAILTNDETLAKKARHLTTTSKVPHPWAYVHDEVGYNYRMPNINAALGCAQLEQIDLFVQAKRNLFSRYRDAFNDFRFAHVVEEPSGARSNYWLQTLLLSAEFAGQRDEVLRMTNEIGIMSRPAWALMHTLEPYKLYPRMDLSVAEALSARIINIPSSARLGMSGVHV